jgi:microcystin-dependent protein
MSQPYIGEIRIFAGNFAPVGWHFCDGSLLAISEYSALFQLIGTTYGGDGTTIFAVPDLRGRAPIHMGTDSSSGQTYILGQSLGVETVTVQPSQIPNHNHVPSANTGSAGTPVNSPANNYWSGWTGGGFAVPPPTIAMNSAAVSSMGGSQPHDNMAPFLTINFIISLFGVFPSQT